MDNKVGWPRKLTTRSHQPLGKHIHRRIAPGDAPAGLSKRPWYQRDIKRSQKKYASLSISPIIAKGPPRDLDFTFTSFYHQESAQRHFKALRRNKEGKQRVKLLEVLICQEQGVSTRIMCFHAQQLVASFTQQLGPLSSVNHALPTRGWTWRIPWRPQISDAHPFVIARKKKFPQVVNFINDAHDGESWSVDRLNGLVLKLPDKIPRKILKTCTFSRQRLQPGRFKRNCDKA